MEGMTYASAVFVTCDLCYKSHGAIVDKADPKSVEAGYTAAGIKAKNCDHGRGVAQ